MRASGGQGSMVSRTWRAAARAAPGREREGGEYQVRETQDEEGRRAPRVPRERERRAPQDAPSRRDRLHRMEALGTKRGEHVERSEEEQEDSVQTEVERIIRQRDA